MGAVPTPLVALIENLDRHQDPLRRVWHLIDALEWVIKWHTAVVTGDLLTRHQLPDPVKSVVAAGIRTPSLGIWMQLYRAALDAHQPERPWRQIDTLIRLENEVGIVRFRNTYAHGAVPGDVACLADLATYRPVLDQLLGAAIVQDTELLQPDPGQPHTHHAMALHHPTDSVIDLWPLALAIPIEGQGDRPRFHFFNALREPRVEILNYEIPDRSRHAAFWEPFHRSLPVQLWREELKDQRALLRTRLQALLQGFAGRDRSIAPLCDFLIAGEGLMWVSGPPGIGKSTLIAAAVHRALADVDHAMPLVAVFLRRGSFDANPAPFLRNLALQIDAMQHEALPPPTGTLESMAEAVNARIGRLLAEEGTGLTLCIDGLDEAPHLLEHLPPPHPRLRLLIGARPTEEVSAFVRARGGRHERMMLDPLQVEEVRGLLLEVVDKYDDRFTHEYVSAVAALSGGNPLYVRLLAEQVFQRPELLGRSLALPRTVGDLLDDTVDRLTSGGTREDELDVLHLLAVAREAVDPATISRLLDWRTARARRAIAGVMEVLLESDDGFGHLLFHDSLRDRLRQNDAEEIAEVRERILAGALTDPPASSPAGRYLGRNIVGHVLENGRGSDIAWLHRLCVSSLHLRLKLAVQAPTEFFDDCYRMHQAFDPHQRESFLDSVQPVLANALSDKSVGVDASTVHALLGYRHDTSLIDSLLDRLIRDPDLADAARLSLRVVRGGRRRRLGDLEEGRKELEDVREALTDADGTLRARVLYELGYIAFLRDDVDAALDHVAASARAADDAGDVVGAWISRCVRSHIAAEHLREGPPERAMVLDQALPVFTEHAAANLNASRWIGNVHAHRVDLTARTGDVATARESLALLESLSWFTGEGRPEPLLIARGQVQLAEGRWADAVTAYREVLGTVEDRPRAQERRASLLAEFGTALLGTGDAAQAAHVWEIGLRSSDEAANGPGKRRIRDLQHGEVTDVPGALLAMNDAQRA